MKLKIGKVYSLKYRWQTNLHTIISLKITNYYRWAWWAPLSITIAGLLVSKQ